MTDIDKISEENTLNTESTGATIEESTVESKNTNPEYSYDHYKPVIDSLGRSYATGKRKSSIARVWIKPGKGSITVNTLKHIDYFKNETLIRDIMSSFVISGSEGSFDVIATLSGGGVASQAGALRQGISKALAFYDPQQYRKKLRESGLLTRDSRVVERKKYGKAKARKSYQFSKR